MFLFPTPAGVLGLEAVGVVVLTDGLSTGIENLKHYSSYQPDIEACARS